MRSPWTATALATVVLIALVAVPAEARTVRRTVAVPLPQAGTIHLTSLTVRARVPSGRRPRLRLRLPRAEDLPPSVRILWAKRHVRRGRRVTHSLLLMTINVATPAARAAQEHRENPFELGEAIYFYVTSGGYHPPDRSDDDLDERMTVQRREALAALMRDRWMTQEGAPIFRRDPPDPTLDTGHYDDGHSFGWNPRGQQDAWSSLTTLANQGLDQVIADIEANLAVDVDGDGQKGAAPVIDTVVGPPVITGGR